MRDRLDWAVDGLDWPHRNASRFVQAGGLQWHLQEFGPAGAKPAGAAGPGPQVPTVLLLHGTAASSHSWRAIAPALGQRWRVLVPDLPGHGFTHLPVTASALSLPGMAAQVSALLAEMNVVPDLIVGHSAGAAIGVQMVLDAPMARARQATPATPAPSAPSAPSAPAALVSLNGAFIGFGGLAGALFSPLARLLSSAEMVARLLARQARDPALVRRLLDGTGSRLDEQGLQFYARLLQSPGHVRAALGMMAHWDLAPLGAALPRLSLPVWLVAAGRDLTVPPSQAAMVAARLPHATQVSWPMLGHLAHEERPELCLQLLAEVGRAVGLD